MTTCRCPKWRGYSGHPNPHGVTVPGAAITWRGGDGNTPVYAVSAGTQTSKTNQSGHALVVAVIRHVPGDTLTTPRCRANVDGQLSTTGPRQTGHVPHVTRGMAGSPPPVTQTPGSGAAISIATSPGHWKMGCPRTLAAVVPQVTTAPAGRHHRRNGSYNHELPANGRYNQGLSTKVPVAMPEQTGRRLTSITASGCYAPAQTHNSAGN